MPRPSSWVARGTFACALATTLTISIATAPLEAQRERPSHVQIRGVSAAQDPALTSHLRSAVEESLATLELRAAERAGFVLDVSITHLRTEAVENGERIDCEVSILVEDARRHAIRGVLTGRARVIGDSADSLAVAAVSAAARGAMRSLPSAIAAR